MKNKLKELMQILLNQNNLSEFIQDDSDALDELAKEMNTKFNNTAGGVDELKTHHDSGTYIAPVIFSGILNKPKFDLVYMGLNPYYDITDVHNEKASAGKSWDEYFDFYTSPGIFNLVIEGGSNYYTNVTKILYSLYREHDLGKIGITDDIEKKIAGDRKSIFHELLNGRSVIFPELIPFHSKGFTLTYKELENYMNSSTSYQKYLQELMGYLKITLDEDALIIGNGQSTSKLLKEFFLSYNSRLLLDHKFVTLLEWEGKIALLFNYQLYSQHGLPGDLEIDTTISKVKNIKSDIKNRTHLVRDLEEYLNDVLIAKKEKSKRNKNAPDKSKKLSSKSDQKNIQDKKEKKTNTISVSREKISKNQTEQIKTESLENVLPINKEHRKIIDEVMLEVIDEYKSVSINTSTNRYFYPVIKDNFETNHIQGNTRNICYERKFFNETNNVHIYLLLVDPLSENGDRFLNIAKENPHLFTISKKFSKNAKNISDKVIYNIDPTKSPNLVREEFKIAFVEYLDKFNESIINVFS